MSEPRRETQNEKVLSYLLQYGTITALEAFKHCGTMRLSARIANLKDGGYDIWTERVAILGDDGKEVGHYGRYHLRGIPMEY